MKSKYDGLANRFLLVIADITLFFGVNLALNSMYNAQQSTDGYNEIIFNYLHFLITSFLLYAIHHLHGLYRSVWTYAGMTELINCFSASVFDSLMLFFVDRVIFKLALGFPETLPYYYYPFAFFLIAFANCMPRLGYRVARRELKNKINLVSSGEHKRVMIVGAGYMGNAIIEDIYNNQSDKLKPVVAIDDNPAKKGKKLHGIKIAGNCNEIPELAKKYDIDEIIICIPSASKARLNEIYNICVNTGCKIKTSPSLEEILIDETAKSKIRDIDITDLLSREEVQLDMKVCKYLIDTTILVTGGGGSIGSELCKQCARYKPKTIVIFDIYENCAFELENELKKKYGDTINIQVRIGSVRDMDRLCEVLEEFRPDVIFHAAAHKHVPLMEDSPCEAVKNNVFGTYNVAMAADKYKVEKMVVLSTDKAVNPTNVMGATKRLTEIIVQYLNKKNKNTEYVAVRFGNVLGSHGSVIPLFKKQIEEGGPVTVTHPDITRYFMTIPEAAQLVCQAGGLAKGGEVFVLDMGEPVKIMDLAKNLIKLSGYTVEEIGIEISGLRPGEKLYEELSMESELETRQTTANSKIFVNMPMEIDDKRFETMLKKLEKINNDNVREILQEVVPNYHPADRSQAND